jgi:hypothetical protein
VVLDAPLGSLDEQIAQQGVEEAALYRKKKL